MTRSVEGMFRPGKFYGEPHSDNSSRAASERSFYFTVQAKNGNGDRLSSYVSREHFAHLAGLFGTPPLKEQL